MAGRSAKRWQRRSAALPACCAALAIAAAAPQAGVANSGQLDRSFGSRGRVATAADLGSSWRGAAVNVAAAQGDSTVVASERQLFRYRPNGSLDPEFGENGRVTVDEIEDLHFHFTDVAIDAEGRTVAFGTAEDLRTTTQIPGYNGSGPVHPTFAVILRFDASGHLDPSFGGGDGIVRTDLGLPHVWEGEDHSHPALVHSVAGVIDSEDRPILMAATLEFFPDESHGHFGFASRLVARLTSAGDLDPSFGSGGVAVLNSPANHGLAVCFGEQLLVWSYTQVTRLRADGVADADYGTAGTRTIGGREAVLDRSGRLDLLEALGKGLARVLRLKADGSIDHSFGRAGSATVRLPGKRTGISSIAVDASGRMLLVGSTMRPRSATIGFEKPQELLVVGRLQASGRLDRSFGHGGWLTTGFGRYTKIAGAHTRLTGPIGRLVGPQVLLDSRERLVVADAGHSPELEPGGVILARYLLNH